MQTTTFCLAICLLAQTSAAPPPAGDTSAPFYTRQTAFAIPFHIDAPTDDALSPVEVEMYVTDDRGQNWRLYTKAPPSRGSFVFHAPRDGEYWFLLRTRDQSGRLRPEGPPTPELQVVVDTTMPKLELQAWRGTAGQIHTRYVVRDAFPGEQPPQIEYQLAGPSKVWAPVEHPAVPQPAQDQSRVGQATFFPTLTTRAATVRVAVMDRAGNRAVSQVSVPSGIGTNPTVGTQQPTQTANPPVETDPTAGLVNRLPEPIARPPALGQPNNQNAPRRDMVQNLPAPPTRTWAPDYSTSGPLADVPTPEREPAVEPVPPPMQNRFPEPGQSSDDPSQIAENLPPQIPSEAIPRPAQPIPDPVPRQTPASAEPSDRITSNPPSPAPRRATDRLPSPPSETAQPSRIEERSTNPIQPDPVVIDDHSYGVPEPRVDASVESSDPNPYESEPGDFTDTQNQTHIPELDESWPSDEDAPEISNETDLAPSNNDQGSADIPADDSITESQPANDINAPLDIGVNSGGIQLARVNSTSFELDYEVDSVGNSGIGRVELWGTRDDGRSWRSYGVDEDNHSPLLATVEGEGIYGFRIVVQNGSGLGGLAPRPGDRPEMWIGVDLTKPKARILGIDQEIGLVTIRWEAFDEQLAERPVALLYGPRPEGPFASIAAGLENYGVFRWRVDDSVADVVYIRLEVRDAAGNVHVHDAPEPVQLLRVRPKARIRGVRPSRS